MTLSCVRREEEKILWTIIVQTITRGIERGEGGVNIIVIVGEGHKLKGSSFIVLVHRW